MRVDRILGYRNYEMTDHLGNVLASVLDRKTGVDTGTGSTHYAYYNPDMSSVQDYYPFGWRKPQRHSEVSDSSYQFGFNGMMKDNSVAGPFNHYDFGARVYSPQVASFLSTDPLAVKYPGVSPYVFVRNNPILKYDPDGNTDYTATVAVTKNKDGTITKTVTVDVVYAIINLSQNDIYNKSMVVGEYTHDATFSGSFVQENAYGETVKVNVIVNFKHRLVNSLDEVRKGENVHLIVDEIYKDPYKEKAVDPIGLAVFNGDVMATEYRGNNDRGLMKHERGHNFGLYYNENKSDPLHALSPSHFMYYKSAGVSKGVSPAPLSSRELSSIFSQFANYNSGVYEINSNSSADVQSNAQEFLNNMKYDRKKAQKAGF